MKSMVDLSIIIVNYNSVSYLCECLDSIERTKGGLAIEVFVVDNGSHDNSVSIIEARYPNVTLIRNFTNLGFPAANNQAISIAQGRCVMLLNPDTVVLPGALHSLISFLDGRKDCGVCGPVLLDSQKRAARSLRRPTFFNLLLHAFRLDWLLKQRLPPHSLQVVSGACLVFRRSLVSEVGLLDERLFWCEDVDFCTRVRLRNYLICIVPSARIVHVGGGSAKTNIGHVLENQYRSKIMFFKKHASATEFTLVVILLLVEAALKSLVWRLVTVLHPTADGILRARTYTNLMGRIAHLFRVDLHDVHTQRR